MRGSLLVVGLVGMLGLVPNACALGLLEPVATPTPGDPTPNAPTAIRARYQLDLVPSLDAFDVRVELHIMEIELQGPQGVAAQAIRDGGPGVQKVFEEAVRARIDQELRRAFTESNPQLASLTFAYGASDADTDLYHPGIDVVATAKLPLTGALLGVSGASAGTGADWARAFFYSGGSARIERSVLIPAGFDASLKIVVPDALRLASPGPKNGTTAEFAKDNLRGQGALPLYIRFEVGLLADQVPKNVRDGPLVRATFRADDVTPLWLQAIPFTNGRYAADLDLDIEIPSLSTAMFEEDLLPQNLRLQRLSADLVRLAARDGLIGGPELEGYFHALIQESLREDFGDHVQVTMDSEAFQSSLARPVQGVNVEPILVRAHARLPIKGDQMLASSSMARSIGMITGSTGSFDLKNEGEWRLDLTLLYPRGAQIEASDSAHLLQEVSQDGRQGFHVTLVQGQSTDIHVWGRPSFDAAVFIIGLLELAVLITGAVYLTRWARARLQQRRFPWSPQRA